jgi:hypothetical protein
LLLNCAGGLEGGLNLAVLGLGVQQIEKRPHRPEPSAKFAYGNSRRN